MQQQASKEGAKEAAKAQRQQGRARLQAIPSPDVSAARAGAEAPKEVAAVTEVTESPKPETLPNNGKGVRPTSPPGSPKPKLPSYLRVVK
jgi:hypothetical protein